jgi:hypothetical protein
MRSLLPLVLLASASASPPPPHQCSPPQIVVPSPNLAPGSTYTNDGEPPQRFAHAPKTALKIMFGQEALDSICGRPPCGFYFEGCQSGDTLVLLDPFKTDDATFARIVRHELAHVNHWPATHGQ